MVWGGAKSTKLFLNLEKRVSEFSVPAYLFILCLEVLFLLVKANHKEA